MPQIEVTPKKDTAPDAETLMVRAANGCVGVRKYSVVAQEFRCITLQGGFVYDYTEVINLVMV